MPLRKLCGSENIGGALSWYTEGPHPAVGVGQGTSFINLSGDDMYLDQNSA
jgi:hypothetical protein